jgi:hypothetical protein
METVGYMARTIMMLNTAAKAVRPIQIRFNELIVGVRTGNSLSRFSVTISINSLLFSDHYHGETRLGLERQQTGSNVGEQRVR